MRVGKAANSLFVNWVITFSCRYVPAGLVITLVYVYWNQLTSAFNADWKAATAEQQQEPHMLMQAVDRTGYGPTETNWLFSAANITRAKQRFDQVHDHFLHLFKLVVCS